MIELRVVDSHTEGEPTRVIVGCALPALPMRELRDWLAENLDVVRQALTREPWGTPVQVGAFLTIPSDPRADYGVVFFNNAGYLGMCGHGTIGVVETIRHFGMNPLPQHLGRGQGVGDSTLSPRGRGSDEVRGEGESITLETPVGLVTASILGDRIQITNVASYKFADVSVETESGAVQGEIAYGGNWFFITHHSPVPVTLENLRELEIFTENIQSALDEQGIAGENGERIDHIEVCVPSPTSSMDSRNYVRCPGGEYDRSPCGTGTSAHMACLFAGGQLAEGQIWRQESILGTYFEGSVRREGDHLIPSVSGRAWITGDATVWIGEDDPMRP